MPQRLSAILAKRSVLVTLVRRDLRVRYSQSALGYVWTILDPLLMVLVYFVVFTYIFKVHRAAEQPYFLYLMIGQLVWQWFTGSVNDTTRALVQEAKLVRSTNLPRELWVIRVVLAKGIEFLLSLPILLAFVVFYVVRGQTEVNWGVLLIPVGVVVQFLFLVAIGLILAPVNVLVTDTTRVVRIVLRFLFYLTPILYGIQAVPAKLRVFLQLNPLSGIIDLYRAGFFGAAIEWKGIALSLVSTLVLLVAGFALFARLERPVLKEI